MTSNITRVGVLGAGQTAELNHLPVLAAMPDVEISWLCDLDKERAEHLARAYKVKSVYQDIGVCGDVDAVLVSIPVGLRREPLETIFQRGWHALIEKPFARTVEEHRWITERADKAGVQLGAGLMRRFYHSTTAVQKALDSQIFGKIQEVWASEMSQLRRTGRAGAWYQTDVSMAGGGVLMETGAHLVDQVFQATGVTGIENIETRFEFLEDIDLEYQGTAQASTRRHGSIPIHFSLTRTHEIYTGIVITCEAAEIEFDITADTPVAVRDRDGAEVCRLEVGGSWAKTWHQAFYLEWAAFLEGCSSGQPSAASPNTNLLATQFIESSYQAGRAAEVSA
ncbi:MAG: Gfo/Idh/MocA family oxidoreductase [SAR202 cluster bacterium]|nr:Gfo/Idh/MocA family oxidoreductase [SAR202 cluster bacterium]